MTETWALIPVKQPAQSKTRLLSVLRAQECARLSRAMFMDVLTAVDGSTSIERVAVLTNDDDVAALATQLGHTVIRDGADARLRDGLTAAAQDLAARGAGRVVILPGDLPTVTAADIDQLLAQHDFPNGRGLSLCPAIRDGGTNALVCSPADAIEFQFGPDSAERHLQAAAAADLPAHRLALPAFFRDIDIAEDLVWLSSQDDETQARRFLTQSGIFARLASTVTGATA